MRGRMTLERLLLAANLAAIVGLIWLAWWLTRVPKPKRGGFVADRWKRTER